MVTTIPRLFFICLNSLALMLAEYLGLNACIILGLNACGILWPLCLENSWS